jgi:hypothetical protein
LQRGRCEKAAVFFFEQTARRKGLKFLFILARQTLQILFQRSPRAFAITDVCAVAGEGMEVSFTEQIIRYTFGRLELGEPRQCCVAEKLRQRFRES